MCIKMFLKCFLNKYFCFSLVLPLCSAFKTNRRLRWRLSDVKKPSTLLWTFSISAECIWSTLVVLSKAHIDAPGALWHWPTPSHPVLRADLFLNVSVLCTRWEAFLNTKPRIIETLISCNRPGWCIMTLGMNGYSAEEKWKVICERRNRVLKTYILEKELGWCNVQIPNVAHSARLMEVWYYCSVAD